MRSAYLRAGARALGTPRRRWTALAFSLLAVSVVVLLGFGWYVSERVADGALRPRDGPRAQTMTVVAAGGGTVTLQAGGDDNWRRGGVWGLEWSSGPHRGYARVAAPVAIDEQRREVTRSLLAGDSPPVGASARLDRSAYTGTPAARGLPFEEVNYPADQGPTPAWLVPGGRSTWVIYVHGRSAGREEGLRFLRTFADLDLPTLVIAYRNDEEAPGGAAGHYAYGQSEWRDVEAAVGWARAAGARDIVLMGSSMGGGIVLSFLYRSELASVVRGAILDAPMLSFDTTVDFGLAARGVPGFYRWLPMWITAQRFEIDWDELDYLGRADELSAPLLLIHGSEDETIPVELSDELARARPDLVTYERFEGARHAAAWNLDRARYEAAVVAFLTSIAPRSRSLPRAVRGPRAASGTGGSRDGQHPAPHRNCEAALAFREACHQGDDPFSHGEEPSGHQGAPRSGSGQSAWSSGTASATSAWSLHGIASVRTSIRYEKRGSSWAPRRSAASSPTSIWLSQQQLSGWALSGTIESEARVAAAVAVVVDVRADVGRDDPVRGGTPRLYVRTVADP